MVEDNVKSGKKAGESVMEEDRGGRRRRTIKHNMSHEPDMKKINGGVINVTMTGWPNQTMVMV